MTIYGHFSIKSMHFHLEMGCLAITIFALDPSNSVKKEVVVYLKLELGVLYPSQLYWGHIKSFSLPNHTCPLSG